MVSRKEMGKWEKGRVAGEKDVRAGCVAEGRDVGRGREEERQECGGMTG